MAEWMKIKADYIRGEISYRKLADKYKVSFDTLRKRAAKENWRALRDKAGARAATKLVETQADRKVDRLQRIIDVSDKLLCVVENTLQNIEDGIESADRATLRQLAGTIKDIKDTQNLKTELDLEEQRQRIAMMKKRSADEVIDRHVEIVFVPLEGDTENLAE